MTIYYEVNSFRMTKLANNEWINSESIDHDDLGIVDIEFDEYGDPVVNCIDISVMPTCDDWDNDNWGGYTDPVIEISIGDTVPNFEAIAAEIEALLCELFPEPMYNEDGTIAQESKHVPAPNNDPRYPVGARL